MTSYEDAISGQPSIDPQVKENVFGRDQQYEEHPDVIDVVDKLETTKATMLNSLREDSKKFAQRISDTVFKPEEVFELSEDQADAWAKLEVWAQNKEPYFVLRGFAGTGKTHLMKMLAKMVLKNVVYFTAPTNKATDVLCKMLETSCKTIYSLLGLRMSQEGEELELVWPARMPDLSYGCIIVVDEAGMVNKQLCEFIDQARRHYSAKILYVGDPAQLPPIGETSSKVWKATQDPDCRALLKKVMRFDNQLLKLATHLRHCVRHDERPVIENDNDGKEGVFVMSERKFWDTLLETCKSPQDFKEIKVLAWRNKTVDSYNDRIRKHLRLDHQSYCEGELLMLAQPLEINNAIVASIDEEVTIMSVLETLVALKGYEIPVYELLTKNSHGTIFKLNVPTEDDIVLQTLLSEMADKAKRTKDKNGKRARWKEFWEAKNKFQAVRYAYAMTTHRAQGSTLEKVFVDKNDILANSDTNTSYRCLYVDATRPTTGFYTF